MILWRAIPPIRMIFSQVRCDVFGVFGVTRGAVTKYTASHQCRAMAKDANSDANSDAASAFSLTATPKQVNGWPRTAGPCKKTSCKSRLPLQPPVIQAKPPPVSNKTWEHDKGDLIRFPGSFLSQRRVAPRCSALPAAARHRVVPHGRSRHRACHVCAGRQSSERQDADWHV